ncbi:Subtilisin-like protein [Mycena sanguinolenta]|uniref:Subtilisin-like protein n=1 Tax=Mycena sanguinolenta TaxID=230812 RepID=A0A8H6XRM3_9AGAR|nr:Subtilisin-like protein [Mycena sanguinolenta]
MTLTHLLVGFATVVLTGVTAAPRPVPAGWTRHHRADPDVFIPLKFTLAQSNVDRLESLLLDVSDPQSPNYGKHWTHVQVKEAFRPSSETVDTVRGWLLHDAGIPVDQIKLNVNGDMMQVNVTIAEAEALLKAEYYVYGDDDGAARVGCHEGYTLPDHVAKHVDLVWPTTHFGRAGQFARRSGTSSAYFGHEAGAPKIPIKNLASFAESGCDTAVTLDCLRALYNFDFTPVSGSKNTVGVVEFEGNVYMPSDLDLFFETYRPDQVGHTPTLISIEGGNPFAAGNLGEPSLDIELMMGLLGSGQNLSLYQVGETSEAQEPADELLAALDGAYCSDPVVGSEGITDCGDKPRTNVISISYHLSPDLNDPTISPELQRMCTEIGKLSLTGITFVASSGDGGVAYSQAAECLLPDGTLEAGNPAGSFVGQFPASCPFITAVGATSVAPGASVNISTSTGLFFILIIAKCRQVKLKNPPLFSLPEGGFSNNFARPDWQQGAVQNYLDNFAPKYASSIFNRSGRAYPDVAANGWPLVIAQGGEFTLSGGTSASAPIFASVVAAINDARIAAGKSPVGFINPALYSPALLGTFNDVTVGSNPGCQTQGFPAAPGWDPVSGLGTPNFEEMKAAFLEFQ